jgi:hypothetical protein
MDAEIVIALAHVGVFRFLVAAIDDASHTITSGDARKPPETKLPKINRTLFGLAVLLGLSTSLWYALYLIRTGSEKEEFATIH